MTLVSSFRFAPESPENHGSFIIEESMKKSRNPAFSLVELIIVIAVIAIISSIIIPSISGTNDEAKRQNAISAAGALNLAMSQYRMKNGASSWDSISGDSSRYAAIKDYLEFSDDDWATFENRYSPYTFEFQGLSNAETLQKVIVKDKYSNKVNY